MAENKLHIRIITPEKVKLDEEADMVIMRCTTGDMGVLPGHEACSVILDYGVMRIMEDDVERRMAVFGGIAQVRNDEVFILAKDAEWPEDIDTSRAQRERELAERLLQDGADDVEIQRNQVMMRRTLVQMEVSSYPLVGKVKRGDNDAHKI